MFIHCTNEIHFDPGWEWWTFSRVKAPSEAMFCACMCVWVCLSGADKWNVSNVNVHVNHLGNPVQMWILSRRPAVGPESLFLTSYSVKWRLWEQGTHSEKQCCSGYNQVALQFQKVELFISAASDLLALPSTSHRRGSGWLVTSRSWVSWLSHAAFQPPAGISKCSSC